MRKPLESSAPHPQGSQSGKRKAKQCERARLGHVQGYYFSRPIPAESFGTLLRNRQRLPHRAEATGALPDQPGSSAQSSATAGQQRTILLVNDEEAILASLRRLLRHDGYHILSARGGEEGLRLLALNDVDVIISDQRVPGMTGVEFLRRVKIMHPHTVRMVLSGYSDLQTITNAINEGAIYRFLSKPWDDSLLRANLEEAFRHKKLDDENRRLYSEVTEANMALIEENAKLRESLAEKR